MSGDVKNFQVRDIMAGVVAGLAGNLAIALTSRLFDQLVSQDQRELEQRIRKESPYKKAGSRLQKKLTGHEPSGSERDRAEKAFLIFYNIAWGLVYAVVRKKAPVLSKARGLPFGVVFFGACDGVLAPLLKLGPTLNRLPRQPNLAEMGNHLVWSVTAETVHRTIEKRYPEKFPTGKAA